MEQINIWQEMYEDFKFPKKEIILFEAFAGIGSQIQALKNIGINIKEHYISEIDKYAIASYEAIHGETINYGSICGIEEIPQVDLFTYSFPCQDISLAGKGRGLSRESGTRSGLLWEVERILKHQFSINKLPKILLMENVKNLVGEKHREDYNEWLRELEKLGYKNYWEILNAKNYGIPQNRERVFCVSILGDYNYTFPKPFKLELKLKDMLQDNPIGKYNLTLTERMMIANDGNVKRYIESEVIDKFEEGDCADISFPNGYNKANRVFKGYAPTITPTTIKSLIIKVPEKYYLSDKMVKYIASHDKENKQNGSGTYKVNKKNLKINRNIAVPITTREGNTRADTSNYISIIGNTNPSHKGMNGNIYNSNNVSPTLTTNKGEGIKILIPEKTAETKGIFLDQLNRGRAHIEKEEISTTIKAQSGHSGIIIKGNYSPSNHNASRIVDTNGIAPTVMEHHGTVTAVVNELRIRKLTPLECWRLMGFKDQQFFKASEVCSNSQLYKQAGNSIVVDILENIFKELFNDN